MKTELILTVIKSLEEVHDKLEDLNLRLNKLDRGKEEIIRDVKKIGQSMEFLQGTIHSKLE